MVYRGMSVHGLCVKWGFEKNLFVASALVFVYVTTGRIYEAKIVFDGMAKRDMVFLAAMFAGYAQHVEPLLSLEVYRNMVCEGVELNGVVMVNFLLAYFYSTNVLLVDGNHFEEETARTHTFSACVKFESTRMTNGIPPNAFSYTILIQGLCRGRNLEDVVDFCVEMLEAGHFPNVSTFTTLIDDFCKDKGVQKQRALLGG
ncbi:hypothetical protein IFM89_035384 [Coptis chinensis]|uniref:Pentatricopeptide repeat-containing protein n=1 Tax=Coptis chinensis TaxID=261450 RepID=A0A835HEM2_9MAGN|nr:hypothetical protein IFM89_035384 [Coptis chinensis]